MKNKTLLASIFVLSVFSFISYEIPNCLASRIRHQTNPPATNNTKNFHKSDVAKIPSMTFGVITSVGTSSIDISQKNKNNEEDVIVDISNAKISGMQNNFHALSKTKHIVTRDNKNGPRNSTDTREFYKKNINKNNSATSTLSVGELISIIGTKTSDGIIADNIRIQATSTKNN